jgi:tetratricopeptide (TPR) repeat protein
MDKRPKRPPRRRSGKPWLWALLFTGLLGLTAVAGVLAGYQSGTQTRQAVATQLVELSLQEQFDLAAQDLEAGRYEVARQRLDFILMHDPGYPGATERLEQALAVLYATSTPTPLPPTSTPTPTRDLRPVEDLFSQGRAYLAAQDWDHGIQALLDLRKSDSAYQTARVDGLFFIALRQRGVDKIWRQANLEGGIYDLALAERFGPLDAQASSARELARLYIIGSSFWEVYPEQAVYYFGQVAAAAPGLHDASGWTAAARYRGALIQYGDQLFSQGNWCEAQAQYEQAIAMGADGQLEEKWKAAALKCSPPTSAPKPTKTPTSGIPPTSPPPGVTPSEPPPPPTNTLPPPTDTLPPPPPTTEPPPPPTETPPPPPTETPPPLTIEPPPVETAPPPG